jgi:hypothetical protein
MMKFLRLFRFLALLGATVATGRQLLKDFRGKDTD